MLRRLPTNQLMCCRALAHADYWHEKCRTMSVTPICLQSLASKSEWTAAGQFFVSSKYTSLICHCSVLCYMDRSGGAHLACDIFKCISWEKNVFWFQVTFLWPLVPPSPTIHEVNIGLYDCLSPHMWQPITCTNDDRGFWRIHVTSGADHLCFYPSHEVS